MSISSSLLIAFFLSTKNLLQRSEQQCYRRHDATKHGQGCAKTKPSPLLFLRYHIPVPNTEITHDSSFPQ